MFGRLFSLFARAQTRRQLSALSDHQLRDIGLTRDQIDDIARRMSEQQVSQSRPAEPRESNLIRALQSA